MRHFITITTEAGPIKINVAQITSLHPVSSRRNGATAHIRLSDGDRFDTTQAWEEVLELIAAASEPVVSSRKKG